MAQLDPKLQKAHSVATHLDRMKKAVDDFHSKLTNLHQIHHDDMHGAIEKLHKLVGATAGENSEFGTSHEPTPTSITASGTQNTQHFTSAAPAVQLPIPAATTPVPIAVVPVPASVEKTVPPAAPVIPAVPENPDMTKTEIQTMFSEFTADLVKALFGSEGAPQATGQSGAPTHTSAVEQFVQSPQPGIGNRSQPAQTQQQPVQRAVIIPVTKENEGQPANGMQKTVLTPTLAASALSGNDQEAALAFMKSARAAEVPVTLVDVLSKIH